MDAAPSCFKFAQKTRCSRFKRCATKAFPCLTLRSREYRHGIDSPLDHREARVARSVAKQMVVVLRGGIRHARARALASRFGFRGLRGPGRIRTNGRESHQRALVVRPADG